MRVRVRLRYEDGGRPIALWRQGFQGRWDGEGVLTLRSEHVKDLNDYVRVARLHGFNCAGQLLDPLYRAEMVVEGARIRVVGMVQDDLTRKFTAQTWACVLMQDQGPEETQP